MSSARPTASEAAGHLPLGEQERGERKHEEERLAVDRLEEEREREEGEVEDAAPRPGRAEVAFGEPVQEHERRQGGGERDEHAGEEEVSSERAPEARDERGVEREEGGRTRVGVVAVLGDADVPAAVPARPDVDRMADVVQERVVPDARERRRPGLEPGVCDENDGPGAQPRPEEDLHGRRAHGRERAIQRRTRALEPKSAARRHRNGAERPRDAARREQRDEGEHEQQVPGEREPGGLGLERGELRVPKREPDWVRTAATARIALAARPRSPATSGTSGSSQIRYCGESTLPKATNASSDAAA